MSARMCDISAGARRWPSQALLMLFKRLLGGSQLRGLDILVPREEPKKFFEMRVPVKNRWSFGTVAWRSRVFQDLVELRTGCEARD